jgi:hypothetical protein
LNINHRLLQIIAIAHIVAGLALPFASQIDVVSRLLIETMFPTMSLTPEVAKQATYVIAVLGPTIASGSVAS